MFLSYWLDSHFSSFTGTWLSERVISIKHSILPFDNWKVLANCIWVLLLQKFHLIDTAGIRKRAAVASSGSTTEALSVNRAFRAVRRSDVVALVIEAMACITEQVNLHRFCYLVDLNELSSSKKVISVSYETPINHDILNCSFETYISNSWAYMCLGMLVCLPSECPCEHLEFLSDTTKLERWRIFSYLNENFILILTIVGNSSSMEILLLLHMNVNGNIIFYPSSVCTFCFSVLMYFWSVLFIWLCYHGFNLPRISRLLNGLKAKERVAWLLWTNGTQYPIRTSKLLHTMRKMSGRSSAFLTGHPLYTQLQYKGIALKSMFVIRSWDANERSPIVILSSCFVALDCLSFGQNLKPSFTCFNLP